MSDDEYKKQNQDANEAKYGDDIKNFSVKNTKCSDGLNMDRGCTDILCFLLFGAAVGLMGYFAHMGYTNGQINKLIAPLDGDLHFCGHEDGYENYQKMFITDLTSIDITDIFDSGICVTECPTASTEVLDCKTTSFVTDCADITDFYDTTSVFDFCLPPSFDALPEESQAAYKMVKESFLSSGVGQYFNDLSIAADSIKISLVMGCVYCFIYIYLMSAFAETIAWFCVFLTQVGLLAGTAMVYFMAVDAQELQAKLEAEFEESKEGMSSDELMASMESLENHQNNVYLMYTACCLVGVLCMGFLCCVCCGYKSLKLAIDVIDASADFLRDTKRILLVPMLYFVLTIIFILVWIGAYCCVASMNTIEADSLIPQGKNLVWETEYTYMALYMLFGGLWFVAWLQYTATFIVIVSACTYYFNSSPETEAPADVGLGFKFAYMYHMGSIAFGAGIIAVIQFIRIVFIYAAQKAAKASGDNALVKGVVACASCILGCIEKICDYLNEQAFAYMAVSGESFCWSAWNGFLLGIKHLMKFSFATWIAIIFTFIGKVAITVGNCYSLFLIMKFGTGSYDDVSSMLGPFIVVGITSYVTASIFLSLFDTVVHALLVALAIDMDMHDGEPAFGPPTFHEKTQKFKGKQYGDENEVGNEMA